MPALSPLAFLGGFEGEIDAVAADTKPGSTPMPLSVLVKAGVIRFDVPEKLAGKSGQGIHPLKITLAPRFQEILGDLLRFIQRIRRRQRNHGRDYYRSAVVAWRTTGDQHNENQNHQQNATHTIDSRTRRIERA